MIAAHHVLDQRIGQSNSPYAQKPRCGWVVIGETCLRAVHIPETITTNKIHILSNSRPSTLQQCPNDFELKTKGHAPNPSIGDDVFMRTRDDEKISLSVKDEKFLKIMNEGFRKNQNGNWSALCRSSRKDQVYQTIMNRLFSGPKILERS